MNIDLLIELINLDLDDYGFMNAIDFELLISSRLSKHGVVKRQVKVSNRGDGRKGRIDVVFVLNSKEYAIEIDRKTPREKSIFKVTNYNENPCFIILRSPLTFIQV